MTLSQLRTAPNHMSLTRLSPSPRQRASMSYKPTRHAALSLCAAPPLRSTRRSTFELNNYQYDQGVYRSHDAEVNLPADIADYVDAVVGLTNRKVPAKHFSTAKVARKRASLDPPNTQPLTPAQVAVLYNFPSGTGSGQTIGIYEMATSDPDTGKLVPAGYSTSDITATMVALGNLPVPNIIDVPVDGTGNSGTSDGETGLDITVAGAIAPKATIAVYFAGAETQNMLHALQMMIHPTGSEPVPSVISISYGWGQDDPGTPGSFSESEWAQFTQALRRCRDQQNHGFGFVR